MELEETRSRLEAAESERDGMKILAGRAADDVVRFSAALTEALDAMENIRAELAHGLTSNHNYVDQQLDIGARIRSQIEGSKQ